MKVLAIVICLSSPLLGSEYSLKIQLQRDIVSENKSLCCSTTIAAGVGCAATFITLPITGTTCCSTPVTCLCATGCGLLATSACCIPSPVTIKENDNIYTLRNKYFYDSDKEFIKSLYFGYSCGSGSMLCSTATCLICAKDCTNFLEAITSN